MSDETVRDLRHACYQLAHEHGVKVRTWAEGDTLLAEFAPEFRKTPPITREQREDLELLAREREDLELLAREPGHLRMRAMRMLGITGPEEDV